MKAFRSFYKRHYDRSARFGNGGNPALNASMGYEFCPSGMGGVLGANSTGLFPSPCTNMRSSFGAYHGKSAVGARLRRPVMNAMRLRPVGAAMRRRRVGAAMRRRRVVDAPVRRRRPMRH